MKKKSRQQLTFVEKMQKLTHAGIENAAEPNRLATRWEDLSSLEERLKCVLGIINQKNRSASNMLFFVMYDIESNKVRGQIVKYLQRKGCVRVQRSIFLADLEISEYDNIRKDLVAVQATYDNNDSILIVPISSDYLKAMKIIGQKIELDVIMHNKNTLFF